MGRAISGGILYQVKKKWIAQAYPTIPRKTEFIPLPSK